VLTPNADIVTSAQKWSFSQQRDTVSKFSACGWSPKFAPMETSSDYTFERAANGRRVVVYGLSVYIYPQYGAHEERYNTEEHSVRRKSIRTINKEILQK
jgi:hypothetical protein